MWKLIKIINIKLKTKHNIVKLEVIKLINNKFNSQSLRWLEKKFIYIYFFK